MRMPVFIAALLTIAKRWNQQVSFHTRMNKKTVVYADNGMLFNVNC